MNPWTDTDPTGEAYDEWINDLLANAPEHFDGDDAAESIVSRYVEALESVAAAVSVLYPAVTVQGREERPPSAHPDVLMRTKVNMLIDALNDLQGTWP